MSCMCVCLYSSLILKHPWIWTRALATGKPSPTTLSRSRVALRRYWRSTVMGSGCPSCLRCTESCINRTCPWRPWKTWRLGHIYALYVFLSPSLFCICFNTTQFLRLNVMIPLNPFLFILDRKNQQQQHIRASPLPRQRAEPQIIHPQFKLPRCTLLASQHPPRHSPAFPCSKETPQHLFDSLRFSLPSVSAIVVLSPFLPCQPEPWPEAQAGGAAC